MWATHPTPYRKIERTSEEVKNFYIGKDGRSYDNSESLRIANEMWKNTHYHFICPTCKGYVQVGDYERHTQFCRAPMGVNRLKEVA